MASKGANYFSDLLTLTDDSAPMKQKQPAKQNKKKNPPAPVRPGKREKDRESGTGRGKEVSKQGHGGWGKDEDVKVIEEAKAEVIDGIKPAPAVVPEKKVSEQNQEKKEEKKEEKTKVKQMTMQQYMTKLESEKIRLEPRRISKPGELESEVQMAKYAILHDGTNSNEAQKKPSQKPAEQKEAKKEQKQAPKENKGKNSEEVKAKDKKSSKEEKKSPKNEKKPTKEDKKKNEKKSEVKLQPIPVETPKEKAPKPMTTEDFFKGVKVQPTPSSSRPPRQPRQPTKENRPPMERERRPFSNETTYQVWTPSTGTTTSTVINNGPTTAPSSSFPREQNRRPYQKKQVVNQFDFPTLQKQAKKQEKNENKPKEQVSAPKGN